MTFTFDLGMSLIFQALAVAVVRWKLGRAWLRHIGTLFLLAMVLYHGVGELLLFWFPGKDPYLPLLLPGTMSQFSLLVGGAILLYAVVYAFIVPRGEPVNDATRAALIQSARMFDWRLMILLALPFVALTIKGSGYDSAATGAAATASEGFSQQFLLLTASLASVAVIARFGRRMLVPVLLIQSVALSFVGERLEMVVAALMVLFAVSRFGVRLSRRQIAAGVLVLASLVWVLSAARANSGRTALNTVTTGETTSTAGGSAKLGALLGAFGHLTDQSTRDQITLDLGYRLDGDSWGAMQLGAFEYGLRPLGTAELRSNLNAVIPHFLNPSKINSSDPGALNDLYLAEETWGLPNVGVLPTQLGTTYGYGGATTLFLAAFLFAVILGATDRWLRRHHGPIALLLVLAMVNCVGFYEKSVGTWFLIFRGAFVLMVLMAIYRFMSTTAAQSAPYSPRTSLAPSSLRPGGQGSVGTQGVSSRGRGTPIRRTQPDGGSGLRRP